MTQKNQNRLVWITGASSGLGRALALKMAAEGWQVAASARRENKLQSLVREAESNRIHPLPLDVTDPSAVRLGFEQLVDRLGLPDIAVLNAGSHKPTPAAEFETKDFRDLFELNLMGTVYCLEAVMVPMMERGSGRIAIVASLSGYMGLPTAGAYGMTKAGLINLAEALRPELERRGVNLQLVNPGFVRTPLTDRNAFKMPFLITAEDAAAAFYNGLQSHRFEIVFPLRFAYLMKLLRLLPYPLSLAVTRRLIPDR